MDWFSWLSRTGLEPSLVYEYGLAMAHNELEEEDVCYFNHEFLQSMGISIAKHRLEIIKLARKDSKRSSAAGVSRLLVTLKTTHRSLTRYIHNWTCREESSSALVVVPTRHCHSYSYSSRWRGSMVKRNKKQVFSQGRLLLTNGLDVFSNTPPKIYDLKNHHDHDDDHEDGYWSSVVEEIKWDTMFQDLKPN